MNRSECGGRVLHETRSVVAAGLLVTVLLILVVMWWLSMVARVAARGDCAKVLDSICERIERMIWFFGMRW